MIDTFGSQLLEQLENFGDMNTRSPARRPRPLHEEGENDQNARNRSAGAALPTACMPILSTTPRKGATPTRAVLTPKSLTNKSRLEDVRSSKRVVTPPKKGKKTKKFEEGNAVEVAAKAKTRGVKSRAAEKKKAADAASKATETAVVGKPGNGKATADVDGQPQELTSEESAVR